MAQEWFSGCLEFVGAAGTRRFRLTRLPTDAVIVLSRAPVNGVDSLFDPILRVGSKYAVPILALLALDAAERRTGVMKTKLFDVVFEDQGIDIRTRQHALADRENDNRISREIGRLRSILGEKTIEDIPSGYRLTVRAQVVQLSAAPKREAQTATRGTGREPIFPKLTTLEDLRRISRVHSSESPVALLNPRHFSLPFIGHESDSEKLWRWLTNKQKPSSFQMIAGPGGRGKTRLAIHLLERIAETCPLDWHAGFLERGDLLAEDTFREWKGTRNTLIIIDDVSRWSDELATNVIGPVSEWPKDAPLLRFLLVDRGAHDIFEWYRRLLDEAKHRASVIFEPILRLAPLNMTGTADIAGRRQLLDAALAALHEFDGRPKLVTDASVENSLASDDMGDPLTIFMAAIVAHEQRDLSPLTYRRLTLADEIVRHERSRLTHLARPPLVKLLLAAYKALTRSITRDRRHFSKLSFLPLHLAACVTLERGMSREQLRRSCDEERERMQPLSLWDSEDLTALISEKALPAPDHNPDNPRSMAVVPITPDIVGEAFIEHVLSSPDEQPVETLVRALKRQPENVAWTLATLIDDFARESEYGVQTAASRIGRVTKWMAEVLKTLTPLLTDPGAKDSIAYRTRHVLDLAMELATIQPEVFIPLVARAAGIYGSALTGVRNYPEAARIFRNALIELKPLALDDPDRYWDLAFELAKGYTTITSDFETVEFGENGDVSATSTGFANRLGHNHSVDLRLVIPFLMPAYGEDDASIQNYVWLIPPSRLTRHLSMLETMAASHGKTSSAAIALPHIRERHQGLSERNPRMLLQDDALNHEYRGSHWLDAGHHSKALARLEEARPLLEKLCVDCRPKWLPHLAHCFSEIADAHCLAHRRDIALEHLHRALDLYRQVGEESGTPTRSAAICQLNLAICTIRQDKAKALSIFTTAAEYWFGAEHDDPFSSRKYSVWGTIQDFRAMLLWEMQQEQAALDVLAEKCRFSHGILPPKDFVGRRHVTRHAGISTQPMLPESADHYMSLEFQHEDRWGISWQYALRARIEAYYALRLCDDVNSAIGFLTSAIDDCEALVGADAPRFEPHLLTWKAERARLLEAHCKFATEPELTPALKEAMRLVEEEKAEQKKWRARFPRRSRWPRV